MENIPFSLLHTIAWSFHNTTGIEHDELFAEASLAYCEAIKTYNASKDVLLTTYVYTCVKNALITFCAKEKHRNMSQDVTYIDIPVTEPQYEFFENYDPDTRTIINIVMEASDDFLNSTMPKMIRGYVRNELREKGWSWGRIWNGIRKIKTDLNKMPLGSILYKSK